MRNFRKIKVNGLSYQWLFHQGNAKNAQPPYLLVVPLYAPKTSLYFYFSVSEPFLLNSGFPAVCNKQPISVNLNRPFFVARCIGYCQRTNQLFADNAPHFLDGIQILQALGYSFCF